MTFNLKAISHLRVTAKSIMEVCPEVTGVLATLVFQHPLNSLEIEKSIWIGRDGPVTKADEVVLSAESVLNLAGFVLERGFKIVEELKKSILEESNKLHHIKQQIEEETRSRFTVSENAGSGRSVSQENP